MPLFVRYFLTIIGVALLITVVTFFIWRPKKAASPAEAPGAASIVDAGLLYSNDGGASWNIIAGSANIVPLVLSGKSTDPSSVYVGTNAQGLWLIKKGTYSLEKVTDPRGVLDSAARIDSIAEAPDGAALYLGTYQKGYGEIIKLTADSATSVYKTPLAGYGVFGVLVDPRNSQHINAAIGDGNFIETEDGARTGYWQIISRTGQGIVQLFRDPVHADTFWGLGNKNILYMTQTGGKTWKELPAISVNKKKLNSIAYIGYAASRGELFSATEYGLVSSADDGLSWNAFHTPVPPLSIQARAFASHPNFPEVFWFTVKNEIFRTDDGGVSWRGTVLPTEKTISMLYVDTSNPKILYAGLTK